MNRSITQATQNDKLSSEQELTSKANTSYQAPRRIFIVNVKPPALDN